MMNAEEAPPDTSVTLDQTPLQASEPQEQNHYTTAELVKLFWKNSTNSHLYDTTLKFGRRCAFTKSRINFLKQCIRNDVIPPTLRCHVQAKSSYSQESMSEWRRIDGLRHHPYWEILIYIYINTY